MDDKKKKYVIPEAEIIGFTSEDIITVSVGTQDGDWEHDDNGEPFSI